MEAFLARIGTVVLTTRALYWATALGSIAVALIGIVSAYVLPMLGTNNFGAADCSEEEASLKILTQWVLYTNVIGLISASMFFYLNKGTTSSVIGSIVWLTNNLQGIVLFFYAQVCVFSGKITDCSSAIFDDGKVGSFKYQEIAVYAHVMLVYLKIFVIICAIFFARCCVKGSSADPRPSRRYLKTQT